MVSIRERVIERINISRKGGQETTLSAFFIADQP